MIVSMPTTGALMYQSCNRFIPAVTFLSLSQVSRGLPDTCIRHILVILPCWLSDIDGNCCRLFHRLLVLSQVNEILNEILNKQLHSMGCVPVMSVGCVPVISMGCVTVTSAGCVTMTSVGQAMVTLAAQPMETLVVSSLETSSP